MDPGRSADRPRGPESSAPTDVEEFRLVAEHSVDPLFHAFDGVVHWIGPAIESTLGWSPEDLTARSLVDLCHPDDLDDLEKLLARVAEGHSGRGVFRLRTKDDSYPWVLLTVGAGADEEGRVGSVGTIREIDMRVRTEQQLHLIAEHASNVLFTSDRDRRVTWVSPNMTRVLGWPVEGLRGAVIEDLLHPGDRVAVEQRLDRLYSAPESAEAVVEVLARVRRRDGAYHWMEVTAEVLLDMDGHPDGVVGGFVDVDELVEARNRIRQDATRLRAILDGLLDPHAVLAPVRDETGRIVDLQYADINDAGVAYMRAPKDQITGSRISTMLPSIAANGLLDMFIGAIETGEPLVLEDFLFPAFEPTDSDRHFEVRAIRVGDALSVIWRDVTEQRETVAAVAASEEQYRLLAENSSDVVIRGRQGRIVWVSPSLTGMLGWSAEDWVDRRFDDFVHPDDVKAFEAERTAVESGVPMVHRYRLRDPDLAYHWVEAHATPYLDEDGHIDGAVASFRTIDEEVAAQVELDRRARYDELTGLLNRKEVLERIATLSRHVPRTGSKTAVLFCDIDHFKSVNDAYGHAAGDAVLREVATRITSCIRRGDVAARVGGDEMLVVLDGVHDLEDAITIAEKMRRAVSCPLDIGEASVVTSVSIGVSLARAGESIDELVARADDAMFRAKAGGRNRVITIGTGPGADTTLSRSPATGSEEGQG